MSQGLAAFPVFHFSVKSLALCVACLCIIFFDGLTAMLALFSLLSAGAAKLLQHIYSASDEFIEDLMNIGMAGVGTLVVLFILA